MYQVRRKRLAFWLLGLLGSALTGCAIDDRTFDEPAPAPSQSVAPNEPGAMVGSAGNPGGEGPGRAPALQEGAGANASASDAGILDVECSVGASECTSATEQRECDIDGHWASPVACAPACIGDRCGGECLPSTTECVSAVQFRACSSDGVWSAPQECEAACVGNACAGECKPNDTRCVSATEVQTCTDQGVWAASTLCTNACVDRACTGECIPTTTRCPSATQLQTCNALGQWQAPEPCPLACVGDACGGECAPNARRCHPETGVPQLCSAGGAWQDQAACPFLCVGSGSCGGECAPNDRRCNPSTGIPQLCSPGGAWQNQPACQFVCQNGFCGGECRPNSRRCDTATGIPQLCSAAGTLQNQAACPTGSSCAAGECVCVGAFSECNDSCVDQSSNPNHCGGCNHSCLGGTCVAGACQQVILATGQNSPSGVVLDASNIYWSNGGTSNTAGVFRVSKDGGAVQSLISATLGGIGGLAIGGNQLYFALNDFRTGTSERRVMRANLDGSGMTAFSPAHTEGLESLLVSGNFVFYAARSTSSTSIFRAPLLAQGQAGAGVESLFASEPAAVVTLTVAGNCLYYVSQATPAIVFRKCSATEAATQYYLGAGGVVFGLQNSADNAFLYFSDASRGVLRSPLAGGAFEVLATVNPGVPTVDANALFYFRQTGSLGAPACTDAHTLFRASKTIGGGDPVAIVPPPQACPSRVAVDAQAVYWSTTEGGNVMKLAK